MITKTEIKFLNSFVSLETGRIARQAHGAVVLQNDDLVILATAVSPETRDTTSDFFPLTVEYRERMTAVGKFPGGYIKRESKSTEKETLTARCIDRPMRPLFPSDYFNEVQIIVQVLSADKEYDPDVMSVTAASAAIAVSDIPFSALMAAVRVIKLNDKFIINPNYAERKSASLDFVVAATKDKVVMIEGEAKQAPESDVVAAINYAFEQMQPLIQLQEDLAVKAQVKKREYTPVAATAKTIEICETFRTKVLDAIYIPGKVERNNAIAQIKEEFFAAITTNEELAAIETPITMAIAFDEMIGKCMRDNIRTNGKRPDGRTADEVRQITCEVGILPKAHGAALFTRGETQSLAVVTLGTVDDMQMTETLAGEFGKSFMLHYSFPPYSVGEAKPIRAPGRREIGHGNLAERSLKFLVPQNFNYTIRITSDITESNGSSSMASVCAGCLAMMDAGIPIEKPVAGISVGLVDDAGTHTLFTDIIGDEDHYGHMDFKVAGTESGVTGVQVDLKVPGLSTTLLPEIFEKARIARNKILDTMKQTLAAPRAELSPLAPKILTIKIPVDKIGLLIGPGGKNIRGIQEQTGVKIAVEDDGTVQISGDNIEIALAGKNMVEMCVATAEIGKIYNGTVTRLMAFGAFVKILPDVEGMVHISEISEQRVEKIEDALKEGDVVQVRVIEIDEKGRVNLTMKKLNEPFDPTQVKSRKPTGNSNDRPRNNHGNRPHHGNRSHNNRNESQNNGE